MESNRHNFVILDRFLPFYPPVDPENENFEKMKNTPADIIILQMCPINDTHMMYGSWDMECNWQKILSFSTIFCPFIPRTTWKIKILKKMKKNHGDIIILHKCILNNNHMMYGSWDMECHGQNFLSFWTIFCTFTTLKTWKIKIVKKMRKNSWKHYHFTHVYHKWQLYDVWFLRYKARQTEFFVILDCFLPFYPPNNPKNQNFAKLKKPFGDIIILHMCIINDNHMMYDSWDIERDGQIFLSFRTIFCPFTPLTTQKIKILTKWKKDWRYYLFTHV